jgi:acyl-CoA thioester hydrolase
MARPFQMQVRVRLPEADAMGVVYYGRYYTYFDLARLEMLRELGLTLDSMKARKLGFVAASSSCRYHSSARFDELLTLQAWVAKLGKSSVTYGHRILKGRKLVAEGEVVDVLVNHKGRAVEIPHDVRKKLAERLG